MVQQQEHAHTGAPHIGQQGLMLVMALFALIVGGLVWMMMRSGHPGRAVLHPVGTLPMQTLTAVPDNQLVHIAPTTLVRLADLAITPDQALVDVRDASGEDAPQNGAFNNEWTIVKSGGKITVYAWTSADQALELANGQATDVFSSRPPWMPAANLTEVHIPLYRFINTYTDAFTRFAADGKEDAARSVLESDTLSDADTAVKNLLENKFYYQPGNIQATVQDNTVTLGGNVDVNTQQHVRQIAKETLQKIGAPYHVTNEWNVQ